MPRIETLKEASEEPSTRDRVALLLAMKEPGTHVSLEHVMEKVGRDTKFLTGRSVSSDEIERELSALVTAGLVERVEGEYAPLPAIHTEMQRIYKRCKEQLNMSYARVWVATQFYPHVANLMIPFLRGRAVSAVKIFSGKRDPIREVDPIFVRYARYKPRPVFLTVETRERLMQLVYDHCIDFVPYIHPLDRDEPDVFVLDMDAGDAIAAHPRGFDYLSAIVREFGVLLRDAGIAIMAKFSGSRGFQIWARLDNAAWRNEPDVFRVYRELATQLQRKLETHLRHQRRELESQYASLLPDRDQPLTTAVTAHKEARTRQILVDASILKPKGDVRAPFSIHYKTGLVSVPVDVSRLTTFRPENADPFDVLKGLGGLARLAQVPISNPSGLLASP